MVKKAATWTFDDYDEMGRHYYCSECGCGIMVADNIGHWTPNKCPNCKAKMEALKDGSTTD